MDAGINVQIKRINAIYLIFKIYIRYILNNLKIYLISYIPEFTKIILR